MKKKLVLSCGSMFAVLLLCIGRQAYKSHLENCQILFVQNIEALSQGEDGIEVEDCYFRHGDEDLALVLTCNPSTTTKKIYKCPEQRDWIRAQSRGTCYK